MEMNKGRELKNLVLADGPVDDFIVVDRFPEIDYVLIYRNAKYEPWVAAWGYNEERKSWGQGHYFADLCAAVQHIMDKLREKERKDEEEKEEEERRRLIDKTASEIELDYIKNHLWETKRYDIDSDEGFYIEISLNTDAINKVDIVLYREDEYDYRYDLEYEWYVDDPNLIAQNIRALAETHNIFG